MYVCVCKAVTESKIRKAVAEGACSLRDLRNDHGLGTSCGKCVPQAHEVLKGCLERDATPTAGMGVPGYFVQTA